MVHSWSLPAWVHTCDVTGWFLWAVMLRCPWWVEIFLDVTCAGVLRRLVRTRSEAGQDSDAVCFFKHVFKVLLTLNVSTCTEERNKTQTVEVNLASLDLSRLFVNASEKWVWLLVVCTLGRARIFGVGSKGRPRLWRPLDISEITARATPVREIV